MLEQLHAAVRALWTDPQPNATWVLLEEQLLHSRIPDLVLVRIDISVLRARISGNWSRPLRLTELRVVRALRSDRSTRLDTIARRARTSIASTRKTLSALVRDRFVTGDAAMGFRRHSPIRPIAQRVVTFEAKRSDPGRALSQARAHRAWANETYVAFDAEYRRRFLAYADVYSRLGLGLIEITPEAWKRVKTARPHRRSDRLEAGLVGERVLARLLGHPDADRPERRLPHGAILPRTPRPLIVGADASWVRTLARRRRDR